MSLHDRIEPIEATADAVRATVLIDPLTGLPNHRAFHETLCAAFGQASELSLALIDVDHFKVVNDTAGHAAGDQVLCTVAGLLGDLADGNGTVARIGGDEFALVLPGRDARQTFELVEYGRCMIAQARPVADRAVTVSAGVCDVGTASDADDLFRLADRALQWMKGHGRNGACIYDPRIVLGLSTYEADRDLARSQALLGIRALARAIDAKDPTTRRHSDRVAALARRIALGLGWSPERVALLEAAALVHDVGKIGIPDSVLFKPGPLDPEEYATVRRHASLGAEITRDILLPEQVAWIRGHHERPDGRGYPDGLSGGELPEGAAILAVADAVDVMTNPRPYGGRKDLADALAECADLVGSQFAEAPVRALTAALEGTGVSWVASLAERAAVKPRRAERARVSGAGRLADRPL